MYRKIVVCIIHYNKEILLQLRSFDKKIIYPGKWGYFSGSIHVNENSLSAVKRELKEELNLNNFKNLKFLIKYLDAPKKDIFDIFTLKIFKKKLTLKEGEDFGLSKAKKSRKLNKYFINADKKLMKNLIKKFWKYF
jgi:8-oxo-dGTP pyrophosphatase MutT (NUDIX family)